MPSAASLLLELNNRHVDGDFFMHFLHSPEQALLVIPQDKTFRPAHLGGTVDDWRGHPRFWDHMQEVGRCERFVERKTLRALGVDRLEFKPTAERREIAPKRELIQREMLEAEKKRLEESKAKNVAGHGASPVPITVA